VLIRAKLNTINPINARSRRPAGVVISIGSYIGRFYNPTRHHSALAFSSPIEYEMMALAVA
jgi:hypothetical protein